MGPASGRAGAWGAGGEGRRRREPQEGPASSSVPSPNGLTHPGMEVSCQGGVKLCILQYCW